MTAIDTPPTATGGRRPPHDLLAERSLLGAMMLDPDALAAAVEQTTIADFYGLNHSLIFAALAALYARGEPADPITVLDELRRNGHADRVTLADLIEIQADTPSTSHAWRYAAILARHTLARSAARVLSDAVDAVYRPDTDPADLVEHVAAQLSGLYTPQLGRAPAGITTWDRFWDRPVETHLPWVIPGQLRIGWRTVIVAAEGAGKTLCTRQIALCAGQGIHPFTFTQIPPVRTLCVDLENPEEHLDLTGTMLRRHLRTAAGDMYQAERTWLWHRPGGINVRTRAGRSQLEAAIAHVRPQLVVISPVYKMFRRAANETDEQATIDVIERLDDLRQRFGFAVILEHHAPKGVAKSRDMVPFGSSVWSRWPECGIALLPGPDGSLLVDRYRADRLPCRWPDRLDRGQAWPWVGWYDQGPDVPDTPETVF